MPSKVPGFSSPPQKKCTRAHHCFWARLPAESRTGIHTWRQPQPRAGGRAQTDESSQEQSQDSFTQLKQWLRTQQAKHAIVFAQPRVCGARWPSAHLPQRDPTRAQQRAGHLYNLALTDQTLVCARMQRTKQPPGISHPGSRDSSPTLPNPL